MNPQPVKPDPRPWRMPWRWKDIAAKKAAQNAFEPSRAAELRYERQLVAIAEQVGRIVQAGGTPAEIEAKLREYGEIITPWAKQTAANMMYGVNKKNVQAWSAAANRAGIDMRNLLHGPGVGAAVRDRIAANTKLIQSLPLEAAERVGNLAQEAMITGSRAEDIEKKILATSDVAASRARTIARTEVSKASTALTLARAESAGSEGYIWRTARDGSTRPSHRAMEGKFVAWNSPPTLDGMTGHAGEFPNCRCYPEPVIPKGGKEEGDYAPPLPTQGEELAAGEQRLLSTWERQETSPVIRHVPGAPLVGVDKATFDKEGKLIKYSLSTSHKDGRHKARVWQATIGATDKDADMIYDQVMAMLPHYPAIPRGNSKFGARYNTILPVKGPNGKTVDVRTAWIYRFDHDKGTISTKPDLTTIYVEDKAVAYFKDKKNART